MVTARLPTAMLAPRHQNQPCRSAAIAVSVLVSSCDGDDGGGDNDGRPSSRRASSPSFPRIRSINFVSASSGQCRRGGNDADGSSTYHAAHLPTLERPWPLFALCPRGGWGRSLFPAIGRQRWWGPLTKVEHAQLLSPLKVPACCEFEPGASQRSAKARH